MFWLKCLYQARRVSSHIQCILCVWEVSFNLSLIGSFYWNFSDGYIFLLSYYIYFLRKNIVQSCLNPSSLLITIYFVFSYRMAAATTSSYESNYIKIAMVVLRVSPRAVRVQFDKEFRPDRLQSILNRNFLHLTNLKKKKRITQPQWELLFPQTGRLLYLFCLN
jgi:hypothetical protein